MTDEMNDKRHTAWMAKPVEEWTEEDVDFYIEEERRLRLNNLSPEDALDEFQWRSARCEWESNWRTWADTKWARRGKAILR